MSTTTPNDSIWTGQFWKATTERTIGTAAQAAIGVLAVDIAADGIPAEAWWVVAVAAAVCILKCLVANTLSQDGPGFGTVEQLAPAPGPVVVEGDQYGR